MTPFEQYFEKTWSFKLNTTRSLEPVTSSGSRIQVCSWDRRAAYLLMQAEAKITTARMALTEIRDMLSAGPNASGVAERALEELDK